MAGVNIATAYIQLVPSVEGLSDNISRAMRSAQSDIDSAGRSAGDSYTKGFGGGIAKIAGVVAGAFAAVKIGDFAKDAVAQASDMNEQASKTQVVFGDAASAVNDFAAKGAKQLGMTSLAAQQAAANFGVFGKSAGLAGQDNAKFSTGMAQLAVDMASFSNTTPDQAIEALGAGLRGETEPLRAYGVLLDDASMRQEAMSMGLISTTKDALTPQQKVLAAHSLILKQTSDAQGDFARTSGGLANQQRILSASWDDAKGKLGAAFLPAVTGVVTAINENFFPVIDAIVPKVEAFIPKVSAAWDVLWNNDFAGASAGIGEEDSPLVRCLLFAGDAVERVRGTLEAGWATLTTGDTFGLTAEQSTPLTNALLTARGKAQEIKPALQDAWRTLTSGDTPANSEPTPLERVMLNLRDFGLGVFGQLRDIWDKLWGIAEKLWTPLGQIAGSLADAYLAITGSGWTPFSLIVEGLLAALDGLATVLDATVVPAFTWLGQFMSDNLPTVEAFVGVLMAYQGAVLLITVATKAWAAIQAILDGEFAVSPIGLIVLAVAALVAAIVYAYTNFDWFKNAVQTAWDVIQNAFTFAWNVIQVVWDGIQNGITALGVAFTWLNDTIIQPVWDGIQNAITLAWTVIQAVWSGIQTGLTWLGATFTWLNDNVIQPVWTGIQTAISIAWTIIEVILIAIGVAVAALGLLFWAFFQAVIQPVWNAIYGAIQFAWDIIQNVWTAIQAALSVLGSVFQWLLDSVITPVWNAISAAIQWAWSTIIQPMWEAIKIDIGLLGAAFQWFLDNVITPVWNAISTTIQWAWNNAIYPTWEALKAGLSAVGQFFSDVWNNVINPVWTALGDGIRWVYDNVISPAFEALKTGLDNVKGWFQTTVDGIKSIWEGIKEVMKAPIKWVIDTIWNGGIVALWNNVVGWLHLSDDLKLSEWHPEGWATGGVVPGYGHTDNRPAVLSGGEGILVPEAVRGLGPGFVHWANKTYGGARVAAGGYTGLPVNGGLFLGGLWDTITSVGGGIRDFVGSVASGIADVAQFSVAFIADPLGTVMGMIPGSGDTEAQGSKNNWAKAIIQFPGMMVGGVISAIKKAFGWTDDGTGGKPPIVIGGSTVSGDLNLSQNPPDFGWNYPATTADMSWSGMGLTIASGTEGLWTGLLDTLNPNIQGGISSIGGYDDRQNVNNPSAKSFHAYGLAVDVNPEQNPNGVPAYGRIGPGVIPYALAPDIAHKYGMIWGGDFTGTPDGMHFEIHVAPNQISGSSIMPVATAGGTIGAGVEQWRSTALAALAAAGQPATWIDDLLKQMNQESSGDPNIQQLSDINFQHGDPSTGLMQVIGSTFRSALSAHGFDVYIPLGMTNPFANILASILYTVDKFGSLGYWAQNNFGPYDNGGWLPAGGTGINLTKTPEPVLTKTQWDTAERALDSASRHGGQSITMHVYQQPGQNAADLAREMNRQLVWIGA